MTHFLLAAMIQCSPIFWTQAPYFDGNDLIAAAGTVCRFPAVSHGSMDDLFHYTKAQTEKFATIHRGPDITFPHGLKGVTYDLTTTQPHGKDTITIRGDVTIANDQSTFFQEMLSTHVEATGPASNIQELSGSVVVDKSGDGYETRITTKVRVTKPKLIPKDKFIQIVGKQIDQELQENAAAIITDLEKVL